MEQKGREVVAEGTELSSLVLQVVDELAMFYMFSRQEFIKLENRCVDFVAFVTFEYLTDSSAAGRLSR